MLKIMCFSHLIVPGSLEDVSLKFIGSMFPLTWKNLDWENKVYAYVETKRKEISAFDRI